MAQRKAPIILDELLGQLLAARDPQAALGRSVSAGTRALKSGFLGGTNKPSPPGAFSLTSPIQFTLNNKDARANPTAA